MKKSKRFGRVGQLLSRADEAVDDVRHLLAQLVADAAEGPPISRTARSCCQRAKRRNASPPPKTANIMFAPHRT